jgi:outer membrane receptor protein involved in Fe transport
MPGKSKLLLLSGAAWILCPTVAWGQAAADTPPSASTQPDTSGDIIVTANKREQSIGSVGMSITALTSDQLKESGVRDVLDLVKVEPSFAVGVNALGEPFYQIRGIGFNTDSVGAPPAVSAYVDEVPYPFAIMTKGAALDLERVEVLKGPQGTLFGQNATGGAVNYIAAKPTSAFKAGLDVDYGRFGAAKLDGFVSGPLIGDTLKARIAFAADTGGDWQYSVTQGDRHGARNGKRGRILLDWTPTERLKVSLNLNAWSDNSDRQAPAKSALTLIDPRWGSFVPLTVNEPIAPKDPSAADWPHERPPRNDQHFYQVSGRIDYRFSDAATLTYLGTYQYFRARDWQSYTGTTSPFYASSNATVRSTYHELRVGGKILDRKLDWVIGGNYSHDDDSEYKIGNLSGSTSGYALGPTLPFTGIRTAMTEKITTKAVFGNVEYHLSDALSITAGARYTSSNNDHTGCSSANDAQTAAAATFFVGLFRKGLPPIAVPTGGCFTLSPTFVPGLVVNSLNQHNVSWRFGVNWHPVRDTLLYATASRGWKAGSFPNITVTSASALAPAVQEEVTAYEAGFKSRLDDGKFRVEGAIFYYDYRNKQSELRVRDPIFSSLNKLLNVPKSEEKGAEVSLTYKPVSGLTFRGSLTYLDSKVTSDFINYSQLSTGVTDTINFKDEQLPNTPKWAGDVGLRYDWRIGGDLGAYLGGDVRFTSKTQSFFGAYHDVANGFPSLVNNGYALLNLRAGVATNDGRWRAELYGENVTNTYYTTQIIRVDTIARYVGMPATYGIRLSYRY